MLRQTCHVTQMDGAFSQHANGRRLYAIETPSSYDPEAPHVNYHLTRSDGYFSQFANSESEIAGVLMDIKKRLQEVQND
jgi:hypothetical protein